MKKILLVLAIIIICSLGWFKYYQEHNKLTAAYSSMTSMASIITGFVINSIPPPAITITVPSHFNTLETY
jgi:NADH:ubiquinone oxidoreductase subunit 4 (subunit M)